MSKMQVLALILLSIHLVSTSRTRRQFQHFYPDVREDIEAAIAANCSQEKKDYLAERITIYGPQCPILYSCIIDNIPSYKKDNMTSAAVLLGLTPFILALLGSNTTELALIALKRPLLSTLLVLGSPSVNPIRTFDYPKLDEDLEDGENKLEVMRIDPRSRHSTSNNIIITIEYLLVGLSVGNLMQLSWQLTLNTIAVTSCDSDMLVQLWIGCAIFTHIFGIATFLTGTKIPGQQQDRARSFWRRMGARLLWGIKCFRCSSIKEWLYWETIPCAAHPELTRRGKKQNKKFIFFSWLASTYTLTHVGFGVTVLSSLAFVSSLDAGAILGRFGASAIVCRAVATYELAGMRAVNSEAIREVNREANREVIREVIREANRADENSDAERSADIPLAELGLGVRSDVSTGMDGARS